jgi:ArsR family transcriptional regulator
MNTTEQSAASVMLWMQSLSDMTRVRLLRLLERQDLTVAELCSILQTPQSTISRHLKLLVDDEWINSRRDGTSHWYRMRLADLDPGQRRLWNLVREQGIHSDQWRLDDDRLAEALLARRSRSQTFFSSAVKDWDRLRSDLYGGRLDGWALAAMMSGDSIVGDLGCGTGVLSQMIAPWARKVIAVDSSAAMLQAARKRLKGITTVDLRHGELTNLPVDKQTERVFREVARATQPGGKLVIADMRSHRRSEYREQLGHTWLGFQEKQIRDWLLESGWRPQRWQPLPADPKDKSPGLFVMTAVCTAH